MPKSKYQFLTEFDFNGLFSIPVFTISVQINPDYADYFSQADLAQIQVKPVDPSVLAKADGIKGKNSQQSNELSLESILEEETETSVIDEVSNQDLNKIFNK